MVGLVQEVKADAIQHFDALARRGFTYVTDGVFDTWRSHADEVLRGEPWSGDCDDLASTVLDLLGRCGVALDKRYRLLVDSSPYDDNERVDHMLAGALDEDGLFWLVGDTFAPAYLTNYFRHRPVEYHRLSETNALNLPLWREGAPFK